MYNESWDRKLKVNLEYLWWNFGTTAKLPLLTSQPNHKYALSANSNRNILHQCIVSLLKTVINSFLSNPSHPVVMSEQQAVNERKKKITTCPKINPRPTWIHDQSGLAIPIIDGERYFTYRNFLNKEFWNVVPFFLLSFSLGCWSAWSRKAHQC